ncbi:oligopeptide transporter, OPT family [Membranicola marinus]|uniref:Oligopeptide transporter, OPT family n=1 Tax=Membranihabitans marinus TaxID=1227546 RepID=A0A953HRA0_9BACT|nr:oligopeptide transporter, OPT family [Membranihabitans marinus]MBY5956841.1 oligopeptide transporter, OPT family [Membranihabitans marinus]
MKPSQKPYIPASKKLPETTVKAFILGALLSMVLASANAYLGLFAGMTVSASIPAAVLSMAILRLFKKSNILENNIVQTAASGGESLAAGVIFTFPALVLMGFWTEFDYLETMLIALCGGVLGVLFTIPLRSALIVQQKLQFPEGVATSEVLKSGEEGGDSVKYLIWGSLIGGVVKLIESGLNIWRGVSEGAGLVGNKLYLYFGINLSPALVAVGYIVGLRIAVLVFAGGVISWWITIPIIMWGSGIPEGASLVDAGYAMWSAKIRYIGVGAMVVGGLWALVDLRSSIVFAVKSGIHAVRNRVDSSKILRTEFDTPMSWVLIGIGALIVPIYIIYERVIGDFTISIFMAMIMVIAGFLFAAVAGYMAGLVGSSNNPISGVTIATILASALILLALMGSGAERGPAAAIMVGAVVCCAAAIAGDNMQDLKAGHILGATPFRQQMMQMVGVVSAALVLPLVLQLLMTGYGFGPVTEANPDALAAPQATLMASVAEGVFKGNLPWDMVYIGMAIGMAIILADLYQKKRKSSFRIPILAVAVGIYLPFELDSAIMLGGIIAWLVQRSLANSKKLNLDNPDKRKKDSEQTGLLIASGLITGEALIGILLAIPVAVYGRSDVLRIMDDPLSSLIGVVVILAIGYWIISSVKKVYRA